MPVETNFFSSSSHRALFSHLPFVFFFFLQDALIHTYPYYFLSFPPCSLVVFVLGSFLVSVISTIRLVLLRRFLRLFFPSPLSVFLIHRCVGGCVTIKSRPHLYFHIKMTTEKRRCFIAAS
jgi:hypothetical protein